MPQFGNSRIIQSTPTIDTVQYTAGDAVGGVQSLGRVGSVTRRGVLKNVSIYDNANQKAALTLLFFQGTPTGTYTNNGPAAPSAADGVKFLGKVEIAAGDYTTVGSKAFATKECSIIVGDDANNVMSCVAVAGGTPTYTANGDLVFDFSIVAD